MPRLDDSNKPDERLALGADVVKTIGEKALAKPTGRLATTILGGATSAENLGKAMAPPLSPAVRLGHMPKQGVVNDLNLQALSPSIKLAHVPGAQGDNNLLGQRGVDALPDDSLPALLVSYAYLPQFLENKHRYHYRDWVMDSGAFTAHASGKEVVLQDYIDCCKKLLAEDQTLTEVYALDVIGDWKASLINVEEMWRQEVQAIPCFHYGEPWDVLKAIAGNYPKIAIGGCVGKRDKDKFAGQCFARVWPKKVHGFGFGSEKSLMLYPWHSVDATNWEIGPCKYGRWASFGAIGTANISVRGSKQNLRAEVEYYLELERKARQRWKKEMAILESLDAPHVHLGMDPLGGGGGKNAIETGLQANSLNLRPAASGNANTNGVADSLSVRLVANAHQGREEAKAAALDGRAAVKQSPTVRLVGAADDITDRRPLAFSKRGKEQIRPRKIKRGNK